MRFSIARHLWIVALCGGAFLMPSAHGEGTAYDQALQQAKAEKKKLVLVFTGSDWNAYSAKLEKEVLDTEAFNNYVREKCVEVKLDFPARTEQDADVKKKNRELASQYQIKSYPTVIILNSEAKELGRLGYVGGGPDNYIAELEKFKTPKPDKKEKKDQDKSKDKNQTTPTDAPSAPGTSSSSEPQTSTNSSSNSQSTATP